MKSQNLQSIERELEKKLEKREKKKKIKMKVSGAGVKRLQKIISSKKIRKLTK